ncbi:MAG: hypothetical protein ACPG4N_02940 [Gammaproteobacteria bacterium]
MDEEPPSPPSPASAELIARQFKRAQTKKITELLDTLVSLGQLKSESGFTLSLQKSLA